MCINRYRERVLKKSWFWSTIPLWDWILLTGGVSPTSETVILEKHVNLMDFTSQDVAEAKNLHGSKERQGKFTDENFFQAVNLKKQLQLRKSLRCKWLETGRVPKEVSCTVHPGFILFPRIPLFDGHQGLGKELESHVVQPHSVLL